MGPDAPQRFVRSLHGGSSRKRPYPDSPRPAHVELPKSQVQHSPSSTTLNQDPLDRHSPHTTDPEPSSTRTPNPSHTRGRISPAIPLPSSLDSIPPKRAKLTTRDIPDNTDARTSTTDSTRSISPTEVDAVVSRSHPGVVQCSPMQKPGEAVLSRQTSTTSATTVATLSTSVATAPRYTRDWFPMDAPTPPPSAPTNVHRQYDHAPTGVHRQHDHASGGAPRSGPSVGALPQSSSMSSILPVRRSLSAQSTHLPSLLSLPEPLPPQQWQHDTSRTCVHRPTTPFVPWPAITTKDDGQRNASGLLSTTTGRFQTTASIPTPTISPLASGIVSLVHPCGGVRAHPNVPVPALDPMAGRAQHMSMCLLTAGPSNMANTDAGSTSTRGPTRVFPDPPAMTPAMPIPSAFLSLSNASEKSAFLAPFEILFDALRRSESIEGRIGEVFQTTGALMLALRHQQDHLEELITLVIQRQLSPIKDELEILRLHVQDLKNELQSQPRTGERSTTHTPGQSPNISVSDFEGESKATGTGPSTLHPLPPTPNPRSLSVVAPVPGMSTVEAHHATLPAHFQRDGGRDSRGFVPNVVGQRLHVPVGCQSPQPVHGPAFARDGLRGEGRREQAGVGCEGEPPEERRQTRRQSKKSRTASGSGA